MHPLLAPACFPISWYRVGTREGWSEPNAPPLDELSLLVVVTEDAERQRLAKLKETFSQAARNKVVLIRTSHRSGTVKSWIEANLQMLYTFKRGLNILSQRKAWKTATLKTRQSTESWELWTTKTLALTDLQQQQRMLADIYMSRNGVSAVPTVWPEDLRFGILAQYYQDGVTVVATDGSVKEDGRMGAAAVAWKEAFPAKMQAVEGAPSSTAAEMVGITLAAEAAPRGRPLIILTDSKTSLQTLKDCQKRENQRFKRNPATAGKLCRLLNALNEKAADGTKLIIAKVKSHRGHPLNETADALADIATDLEPTLDPDEDDVQCRVAIGSNVPRPWAPSMKRALMQHLAERGLLRRPRAKPPQADLLRQADRQESKPKPPATSVTQQWLAMPQSGRAYLGDWLKTTKPCLAFKRVIQAVTRTYPTGSNLHRWKIKTSAECTLGCGNTKETVAHIQCWCPQLQTNRIAAHHSIWNSIVRDLRTHVKTKDTTILTEATISSLKSAIRETTQKEYAPQRGEWQKAIAAYEMEESATNILDEESSPEDRKSTRLNSSHSSVSRMPSSA